MQQTIAVELTALFFEGQAATATRWTPILSETETLTLTPTTTLIQNATLGPPLLQESLALTPVLNNGAWTPIVRDFNGVDMALVPVGCFMMGSEQGEDDEKPVHKLCFNAPFWIDRYEVTNRQFEQFGGVASNPGDWPNPQRPRTNVTWYEAKDFCQLRGARLPTEAEWEYAARGPDGLVYPWGYEFVADNAVYTGNSFNETAEIGSRPSGVSWVGAYDMSGNVWEWVSTVYLEYPYPVPGSNEERDEWLKYSDTASYRVLRGGSFDEPLVNLRASYRRISYPGGRYLFNGVRCALSP